jgi:hypothetical protein
MGGIELDVHCLCYDNIDQHDHYYDGSSSGFFLLREQRFRREGIQRNLQSNRKQGDL